MEPPLFADELILAALAAQERAREQCERAQQVREEARRARQCAEKSRSEGRRLRRQSSFSISQRPETRK